MSRALTGPLSFGLSKAIASPEGVGYSALAIPRAIKAKLDAAAADVSLLYLQDSVGNGYNLGGVYGSIDEWPSLMDPVWSAYTANYLVRERLYDDPTNAYVGKRLHGATAGTSLFADNFNRADGAVGTSSGGQSYGTVTAWAISGNKVVQNTGSNNLIPANDLDYTGGIIHEITYTHGSDTTSTNGSRLYGLYASSTNGVYAYIQHNGVMGLKLLPGPVSLGSYDTGADMTAGEVVTLRLIIDGDWVQAEVVRGGVTYALAAQLSSAQLAALTGRKFLVVGIGTLTGKSWDNLAVSRIAQTRRLNIDNASVGGADVQYHIDELTTTMVRTYDAVLVSLGHNGGDLASDDASTFLTYMNSLSAAIIAKQASVPIIALAQNPEVSPAANLAAHNARMAALPAWAASKNYGLIDVYTGYNTTDIQADGIHPTYAGEIQYRDKVKAAFGV